MLWLVLVVPVGGWFRCDGGHLGRSLGELSSIIFEWWRDWGLTVAMVVESWSAAICRLRRRSSVDGEGAV